MKLVLRRDQKSGITGKITFILEVRAEITDDEKAAIQKYKLGPTMLYQKNELADRGSGLLGMASRMAFHAMNITISVNDLANGKRVECKDILEMLGAEEQIKEACQTFKDVLAACTQFGGEEVIEL